MRGGIWYHLHYLKNVKNAHGGVFLLVACNFTKSNTPPWVFPPFQTNVTVLYPVKTSENQRFFDDFRGVEYWHEIV